MIILHASDIHFGKPHLPELSEALVRFVHDMSPNAAVISGDLTQRARTGEYRAARAFLDALSPHPVITTAGNHDVPLYRIWERVFAPYRNYRSIIAPGLDAVLDVGPGPGAPGGARFVALDSSSPLRAIVNGHVTARQLDFADRSFAAAPAGALRVLVVHHNLVDPGDGPRAPPLRGAVRILGRLPRWGVDLVLSGHIHRAYLGGGDEGVIAVRGRTRDSGGHGFVEPGPRRGAGAKLLQPDPGRRIGDRSHGVSLFPGCRGFSAGAKPPIPRRDTVTVPRTDRESGELSGGENDPAR